MSKNKINFIGKIFLSCSLLLSSLCYAATSQDSTSTSTSTQTNASSKYFPNDVTANPYSAGPNLHADASSDTTTSTASITSSQLGWSGPFSFGVSQDSLDNYSATAKYTQGITNYFAFSGLGEYGPDMYRYGATIGFKLFQKGLFKFSAERLNQLLPFKFDSGDINQRMSQNAYGMRYQQVFNNSFLQDVNVGGYYAKTPNKSLNPILFSIDGENAINYRNIAGATSKGLDVGSDLQITKSTELSGHIYYDDVHYNTIYANSSDNGHGIGGSLGISQLVGNNLSVLAEGSVRKIYNTYKIGVSWLLPYLAKNLGFEVALLGQRVISHNDTPNSNSVGLKVSFNPEAIGAQKVSYQLPTPNTLTDIDSWTSTPAVYMERVLATADQLTKILPPTITFVSPATGTALGGGTTVITGTNFTGATAVMFGNVNAASYTVNSSTQITAIYPPGKGKVDIRVVTPHGTSAITPADQFFYVLPAVPTVTNVSPNFAPTSGGIPITITGTNFTGVTSVHFGDKPAISFTVNSPTQIIAICPSATNITRGVVYITVTALGGTSAVSSASQFTYGDPPIVTAVNPTFGPTTGNTSVTITGNNFTGVTAVSFGDTPALSFTVNSETQIIAISPEHTAGTIHITVTAAGGTSAISSADQFTYISAPTVSSVNPGGGPIAGGTSVTITGTDFLGVTAVNFGGTPAVFTVNGPTQITAISPPHAAGTIDITINAIGGTSATSAADHFIYVPVPTIDHLSPTAGSITGGRSITITGTNFTSATAVSFDETASTSFTVDSAAQITAISPAHSAGLVNVTVTTAGGISNAVQFTYGSPPIVTSVSPNGGSASGGNSINITGSNFDGASEVHFGSALATNLVVHSSSLITVTSPAGSSTVHITVTTPYGISATSTDDLFFYQTDLI